MPETQLIPRVESAAHWTQGPPAVVPGDASLSLDHPSRPAAAPAKPVHQHDTIASYDATAPNPLTSIGQQHLRPVIKKPFSHCDAPSRRLYEGWTAQQQLYADGAKLSLEHLSKEQENLKKLQKELSDLHEEMIASSQKTSWAAWMNRMLLVGYIVSTLVSVAYGGALPAAVVTETAKVAFANLQKTLVVIQAGNLSFKMFYDHKGKKFTADMQLKRQLRENSVKKASALITQSTKLHEKNQRIDSQMMKALKTSSRASQEMMR